MSSRKHENKIMIALISIGYVTAGLKGSLADEIDILTFLSMEKCELISKSACTEHVQHTLVALFSDDITPI